MSKPINVEAQRVYKILCETVDKLRVLSSLNQELFDEVYKREEEELSGHFGATVGPLMYHHASLEQSFKHNIVGPDGKMISLDDELNQEENEENQKVVQALRKTTTNLVREFKHHQAQLKLKAFGEQRSNEYVGLLEVFEQLKGLWLTKLSTPLEEQESVKAQLRLLEENTTKLTETRNTKSENLNKNEEQIKEAKEAREYEIQTLKKTIADENAQKEENLKRLNERGQERLDSLKQRHEDRVKSLTQQIAELESNLAKMKEANKKDEEKMRQDYNKADNNLHDVLHNYDQEMKEYTGEKDKAQQQRDEAWTQLEASLEEYRQIKEERKKREEIMELMKKKEDEQQRQMNLLHRGAEWVQAHWKGLMARRIMEKERKNKKKKRGGKKK